MTTKKILIVISSLKIGGGAQKQAAKLGSKLFEKGYDVTFLLFYDIKPRYEFGGELISYEFLNDFRYAHPLKILFRARKIKKICREKKIDTVISFITWTNVTSILSKILFRNKAKIIPSVRNNPIRNNTKKFNGLMKIIYSKADKIVTQTNRIEHILNDKFSIQNTTVIPNMIDTTQYSNLAKKDLNDNLETDNLETIFGNNFIFITIGSLEKQKSQWYLIRAFKQVIQKKKNAKLVVLGDGDLRKKLKNLSDKLGLGDKVFFLGEIENVFPYLKKSDCFVLTSLYEGFPNVIVEALSQNLPVISTDCVSGPREILCPNLGGDKKIYYPYFGRYGILTKPFKNEIFFKAIDEKPLSIEERMLVRLMKKISINDGLRMKYTKGIERAKDFEEEKIIKKWKKLL